MVKRKPEPLPPGTYTVEFVRMRKVRNKPLMRFHYRVKETGNMISQVMKL